MANEMEVVIGSRLVVELTLLDRTDAAITTYTSAATLVASCWPGDDQAELFAPTVTWVDATAGTVKMTVTAAQSATLTVGRYPVVLTVTGTDGATKVKVGDLVVKPAPGAATAGPVYCTFDEMKRHAGSWLEKLQRADTDQTGFAEERADARLEFEDMIHRHYRGYSSGLGASFGAYSPWTYRRAGFRDPWLVTALAANQLVVTQQIKECVALMALAKICRRQIEPTKDNGYRAASSYFAARADDLAATIAVEIDTNADGQGDIIIPLGTVDSLKG